MDRLKMSAVEIVGLRRQAKMSQSQLARYLSVSTRTVQNWEQGLRRPGGPAVLMLKELEERLRT